MGLLISLSTLAALTVIFQGNRWFDRAEARTPLSARKEREALARRRDALRIAGVVLILATFATSIVWSSTVGEEEKRESDERLLSPYGLRWVESVDEKFTASDSRTGRKVHCSFTKDMGNLVCDGEIRKKK